MKKVMTVKATRGRKDYYSAGDTLFVKVEQRISGIYRVIATNSDGIQVNSFVNRVWCYRVACQKAKELAEIL